MTDYDETERDDLHAVAVIGMAGRFPGASNVQEFWENLKDGKESISFFSSEELAGTPDPSETGHPNYVPARGILAGVDLFDAAFFAINPLEATVMDPQQRIFLELGWEALENAGHCPDTFDGLIGAFAGMNNHTYYLENILRRPDLIKKVGAFQAMLGNEKDFLATRLSYKLGLTGPSENIYTACSTSLVTIIRGVQSLLNFECDLALAGGISVIIPQNSGYLYQEGSMLSPDGHCRPFDAKGQGTTFNNGAGVVVLRRLEDALADGDQILAVVRGTGQNNDGGGKVSFTAPSVDGQADAVRMAIAAADIDPATISFVETHGTGTPLGDPIEIAALTKAFDLPADKKSCVLGSVKSNIGHTVHGAGVAGFIKTTLALKHRVIPPTLFYTTPNPKIDFEHNPFSVNNTLVDWPAGETPRRAGVSSFGVGGTNAHIIVEEAAPRTVVASGKPWHLVPLSARSEAALDIVVGNLGEKLAAEPDQDLGDVAHTLQSGRRHFNQRCFGVFADCKNAAAVLAQGPRKQLIRAATRTRDPHIVFMFPGQGSQAAGMGRALYAEEAVYREVIDGGADLLQEELGVDLRDLLHPEPADFESAAKALTETRLTQPALFLVEYGLAKLWQSRGVEPTAMIGHSIGEYAAACLSGVFSFPDAVRLVAARGRLMQSMPPGDMLSVGQPADQLVARMPAGVELAADNAPQFCVVSGEAGEIEPFAATLTADGVMCKVIRTSHAFHSRMMEPIMDEFATIVAGVTRSAPELPFISGVTGQWITAEEATSPEYWSRHMREPVRFRAGIERLLDDSQPVLLEVGPGTVAAKLARQQLPGKEHSRVISSLDRSGDVADDYQACLIAAGKLWLTGKDLAWQSFYTGEHRQRLALPTYPFERKRFWADIEGGASTAPNVPVIESPGLDQQPLVPVSLEGTSMNADQGLIKSRLRMILEETSGIKLDESDDNVSFMELGLDSLFLTQVAINISNEFEVAVTFRQLIEEFNSLAVLAEHIGEIVDPADFQPQTASAPQPAAPVAGMPGLAPLAGVQAGAIPNSGAPIPTLGGGGEMQQLINQQLQIMGQQLALMSGGTVTVSGTAGATVPPVEQATNSRAVVKPEATVSDSESDDKPKKAFCAQARINTQKGGELTDQQAAGLDNLTKRYIEKTQASKNFTVDNRRLLADPRAVSGFRPLFKEMVYPIVVERSKGCRLWDIDGNEYVDMVNGFGSNFFGYSPDYITDAVVEQLNKGIEIGPQHPLVADVTSLMEDFTGLDRFAFCNTGSEAVLGCMRIARTVTGRKTIAMFAGDYHGIFDEVIVRGTPSLRTLPAAPGIMPEAVGNILVLDYDSPESLKILKEKAKELAGILVEPVQSRNPDLQPGDFLKKLRQLATDCGAAFIVDEVITGFRINPGGAQEYFGVEADLASYGKVVGGGYPIGIIGGKKRFMDALDGGSWQYGDDSIPEVGVTYFAGTFVRHPPALAAARAALTFLKEGGPDLQKNLNRRSEDFAKFLNGLFQDTGAPLHCQQFGSLMMLDRTEDNPLHELFFHFLRIKGVHAWDGRPLFLTLAHTEDDMAFVRQAFRESIADMQRAGFFPTGATGPAISPEVADTVSSSPPVEGAILGRTPEGDPAWFVADPERTGKYIQVGGQNID